MFEKMKINKLIELPLNGDNIKGVKKYYQLKKILSELENRMLPNPVAAIINDNVDALNLAIEKRMPLKKPLNTSINLIIKTLEKECNIVTRNHYRNQWLALGMTVFGVPIGVAYGLMIDNMAMLGVGIGAGMAIGLGYGSSLDKKAAREKRQLDVEVETL